MFYSTRRYYNYCYIHNYIIIVQWVFIYIYPHFYSSCWVSVFFRNHFHFASRNHFCIYFREDVQATISLAFCLSANVFISTSLLEGIFGKYKILEWQFSFSSLKMSICYLSFIIFIKKSAIIFTSGPVWLRYIFSLWLFSRVVFFFFVFSFQLFYYVWCDLVWYSLPWCFLLWKFFAFIFVIFFVLFFFSSLSSRSLIRYTFYQSPVTATNFLVSRSFYWSNFSPNTFWYFFQIVYLLFSFQYSI